MNVVDYLKSNSLDRLKLEYSMRVKQYPAHGLIVLNYLTSSENSPIPNECCGLILSTDFKVVSRSFDRFFNYNECDSVLNSDDVCFAIEKIDGSLIKIYHFNNKWYVSTRGTAFAECILPNTSTTFKEATFEALGIIHAGEAIDEQAEERFQQFCRDCNMNGEQTYIFELTGKSNHIVTQYNPHKYELWLLGIRHNLSGEYTDVNSVQLSDTILRPKQFTFKTIEECIERANSLTDLQEGFVICDRTTLAPILKIKSATYVHVHNFVPNGCIVDKDVCRMILNGEWREFLAYSPHHKAKFGEWFDAIDTYFDTAQAEYERLSGNMKSENDFQVFMKKPWRALAISTVKHGHVNLRDAFMNWHETKQLNFLLKEVKRNA